MIVIRQFNFLAGESVVEMNSREPLNTPDRADALVVALDDAMKIHWAWSRKILHYLLLDEKPEEDVVAEDACQRCRFSGCLAELNDQLQRLNPVKLTDLLSIHQNLHAFVRGLYHKIVSGEKITATDLNNIDFAHQHILELLSEFKTQAVLAHNSIDELTGLPTRKFLCKDFLQFQKLCSRHQSLHALMMVDVDHFKRINDTYGHLAGDRVLKQLAEVMASALRESDRVYRFGGEEFVVQSETNDREGIAVAANRLRSAVAGCNLDLEKNGHEFITITLGVTLAHPGDMLDAVISRADQALYKGKEQGRNCVVFDD